MANKLTTTQKSEIKKLMTAYYNNKKNFMYQGGCRRESYAHPGVQTGNEISGCIKNNKYVLNCMVFAQMIWMGRSVEDFLSTSAPTNKIKKAFNWGYYFDFKAAKNVYGIKKEDGSYYPANTYKDDNGKTKFRTYDNAASAAMELFYKGYEIPYSEADIGDLVFYRTTSEIDGDSDNLEQTDFRKITHVGLVYDIDEDKIPIIMDCSSLYANTLGKMSLSEKSGVTTFGLIRGADLTSRVVMCARHPALGNVPSTIKEYRHK